MSSNCYLCNKPNDGQMCVSYRIPDVTKLRLHGEDITIFFCSDDCNQSFKKTAQCYICKSTQFELQTFDDKKICKNYVNDLSKLNVVLNSDGTLDKFKSESFIEFPNCVDVYYDKYKCDFCCESYQLSSNNPIIFNNINKQNNTSEICYMCQKCIVTYDVRDEQIDEYYSHDHHMFKCIRITSLSKNIQYLTTLKKYIDLQNKIKNIH